MWKKYTSAIKIQISHFIFALSGVVINVSLWFSKKVNQSLIEINNILHASCWVWASSLLYFPSADECGAHLTLHIVFLFYICFYFVSQMVVFGNGLLSHFSHVIDITLYPCTVLQGHCMILQLQHSCFTLCENILNTKIYWWFQF